MHACMYAGKFAVTDTVCSRHHQLRSILLLHAPGNYNAGIPGNYNVGIPVRTESCSVGGKDTTEGLISLLS